MHGRRRSSRFSSVLDIFIKGGIADMCTETLTSKVYETRVDLGITQQQLADATGISVRTIISIEKGRQFPTLLSAMRIAHYFSLSVEQLFEYRCDDSTSKG